MLTLESILSLPDNAIHTNDDTCVIATTYGLELFALDSKAAFWALSVPFPSSYSLLAANSVWLPLRTAWIAECYPLQKGIYDRSLCVVWATYWLPQLNHSILIKRQREEAGVNPLTSYPNDAIHNHYNY